MKKESFARVSELLSERAYCLRLIESIDHCGAEAYLTVKPFLSESGDLVGGETMGAGYGLRYREVYGEVVACALGLVRGRLVSRVQEIEKELDGV